MKNYFSGGVIKLFLAATVLLLTSCGYNTIQHNDESVKAAWSEVVNQYQRRADLVPNLVKTVKAYAAHEKEVFEQVTAARSKVGQISIDAEQLDNAEAVEKYQQAQGELGSAISRLLMVAENYPQLKASELYQDLLSQLEGTENRITVARNRYIRAVQEYNSHIRSFPSLITAKIFGYKVKPNFTVEDSSIEKAPAVEF